MGNVVSDDDGVGRMPGDEFAAPESTSVERATYQEIVTTEPRPQSIDRSTVTGEQAADLVT